MPFSFAMRIFGHYFTDFKNDSPRVFLRNPFFRRCNLGVCQSLVKYSLPQGRWCEKRIKEAKLLVSEQGSGGDTAEQEHEGEIHSGSGENGPYGAHRNRGRGVGQITRPETQQFQLQAESSNNPRTASVLHEHPNIVTFDPLMNSTNITQLRNLASLCESIRTLCGANLRCKNQHICCTLSGNK